MKHCDEGPAAGLYAKYILAATLVLISLIAVESRAQSASDQPLAEIVLGSPRHVASAGAVGVDYSIHLKNLVAIRDQLRDGAYMVLQGEITLLRSNLVWADTTLTSVPLQWSLRHDPLTREFVLVSLHNTLSRGPHLDTLLKDAWSALHTVLIPAEPLQNAQTYSVRMELVLKYGEVPPWLQKALFFWSWELSPKLVWEEKFVFTDWLDEPIFLD